MKTGLYNAGPLFTEGEWAQRKKEGKEMKERLNKDITVYNPADAEFNDADAIRTNKIIFDGDNDCIQKSKFGVFDLDTTDAGTFMEFGMFAQRALYHDDIYIIVKLTDFRNHLKYNLGEIPGYAANGFVSGFFNNDKLMNAKPIPQIYVVNSGSDAIDTINAIQDVLEGKTQISDPMLFHKQYSKGWYLYSDRNKFPK